MICEVRKTVLPSERAGIVAQVVHKQAAVAGIESEREVVQYQKFRVLCENQSESYLRALSAGHT